MVRGFILSSRDTLPLKAEASHLDHQRFFFFVTNVILWRGEMTVLW